MTLHPFRNHWWHVTLRVDTRGLTTGAMPVGDGRLAEIRLDLLDHVLEVRDSAGDEAGTAVLAYDVVRHAADPRGTLLAFVQSAYPAGARTAEWDIDALGTRAAPGSTELGVAHRRRQNGTR